MDGVTEREREARKSQVCSFAPLRAQKYFQKMNDSEGGVGGGGRERVEVADAGRDGIYIEQGKRNKRYVLLELLVWFVSLC